MAVRILRKSPVRHVERQPASGSNDAACASLAECGTSRAGLSNGRLRVALDPATGRVVPHGFVGIDSFSEERRKPLVRMRECGWQTQTPMWRLMP